VQRLDVKFLFLASLMLCVGVTLGIMMAGSQDFTLMPVHAHANLVGWASCALFGLTYKAYPQLQERLAAKLHFALAAPAAVLFPIGIYFAIAHHSETIVIVASLAWAAGVLLFAAQMAGLAFGGGHAARAAGPVPAE
jgi:hypothetical protein